MTDSAKFLTDEQIEGAEKIKDEMIANGMSCEPADFMAAQDAGLKLLAAANEEPELVLHMSSPFGCKIGAALALNEKYGTMWGIDVTRENREAFNAANAQFIEQAPSALRAEWHLSSQTSDELYAEDRYVGGLDSLSFHHHMGLTLDALTMEFTAYAMRSIFMPVHDACGQIGRAISDNLSEDVSRPYGSVHMFGNMHCSSDLGMLQFFRNVMQIELKQDEQFLLGEQMTKSCGGGWLGKDVLSICDRPEVINTDANGNLHSETGPAVRWRDGYEMYAWRGLRIPGEWIRNKDSLTSHMALYYHNIEQRRAACEILGWDRVLNELNAVTINEDDDPQIGTLIEVFLPEIGRQRFLRVKCGTGRQFALPVPLEMETALQANAWGYGLPGNDILKLEVRT